MFGGRQFCAFVLCLPLSAQVFPTGDPVMPPSSGAMQPLTPAEYQKLSAQIERLANVKVIRHLPSKLGPDYRLGINFGYDGINHSWILDRDSDGYKLFLDLRGDGDLSHAAPFRFHNQDGVRRIDIPMKTGVSRWTARFELAQDPSDAKSLSVLINLAADRSGKALVDGHQIPFRLSGSSGRYDLLGGHVSFDREGNGKYESYRPDDRWVNLSGKTFEFVVDPYGSSLTLRESKPRHDRPSLANGSRVPDVSVTDLEGKSHALLRNTAELTLLEFWNTNCGPCREEMPKLRALYDKLPRTRFNIIGVTSDESRELLLKYLAELKIPWPERRESYEGTVHRLFRINNEPTYFLLSEGGKIVDHWVGSGPAISKIEAALK